MSVVLRFFWGTLVVFLLAACSMSPLETSLPNSMRITSNQDEQINRPKTLSSDILSAIALERVTGRRALEINVVSSPAAEKN